MYRRGYLLDPAAGLDVSGYESLRVPLLSVSVADDGYAPHAAVTALEQAYSGCDVESKRLVPGHKVGHFGFFRTHSGAEFWPEIANWIGALVPRR